MAEDKSFFKYTPVFPIKPMDMRYHYYDKDNVLKINNGLFRLITDIDELKEYAKTCEGKIIGFDTETTGLTYFKDQIVGFSLATSPYEGIYVPVRHKIRRVDKIAVAMKDPSGRVSKTRAGRTRTKYTTKTTDFEHPKNLSPKEAFDVLFEILCNAKVTIMHNSEFDLTMLKAEGYDITKFNTMDTTILTYLFDAENKNWNTLKEASKIVLGRHPMKFAEALGTEENFQFVDLDIGYPYGAADACNCLGLFYELFPKVKELLAKAPKVLNLGEGRYNVMKRDNELIRAFTDYYSHVNLYVDKEAALTYKKNIENKLTEVEDKIYSYFNKGQFNLSTSSKEFKMTMQDFNIDTGLKTEAGAVSYGKKGIDQMGKLLRRFKEILSLDWSTQIDYKECKLNKRAGVNELKLAEIISMYGKNNFQFKESANFMTIRSIEGVKLSKPEFFQELVLCYKNEKGKLDVLTAITARNSLMKALNSYITKLTETEVCHMRYRLQGTASGRLSSGNGSKTEKRKNHYFIDLNAQNLTKPHSAYYKATESNEEGNILGWKFELVTEDYYHEHKEDEIIVEGSDPNNNIRACLVAPEGRYIASLDYSAQEYRMIALLSGDHKMLDNFKRGIDPHTATAYGVWGEENYDRQKRKKAKGVNFLMNYNGGPKTLSENLDIPFEEACDIIKKYEATFHECIKWKKTEISKTIKQQDGCAYSIFGRPRQFKSVLSTASSWQDQKKVKMIASQIDPEYLMKRGQGLEKAVERKIVSHAVQSPCGDICRWDLIQLYRKYFKHRDPHIDFYSTVHDEINYTIDKEYTVQYVRELDDLMTFTALGKGVPIITSIDLGYSLGVLFPFEWADEEHTKLVPLRA